MRISIVTPSYNQGQYIRQTIESVLHQNHPDVEHIVMDGGSSDNTVSVLSEYPNVVWVSERDDGQSDALIRGFAKATGQVWSWLNSDDVLVPDVLGTVARYFEDHPDCMVLYGDLGFIDHMGELLRTRSGHELTFEALSRNPDIVRQPSTFWRSSVMEEVGCLDPNLQLVMDYDFLLRASRRFEFHYIPLTLSYYRTYPENKTNSMLARQAAEILRVYRKNGIPLTFDRLQGLGRKALEGWGITGALRPIRAQFRKAGGADAHDGSDS